MHTDDAQGFEARSALTEDVARVLTDRIKVGLAVTWQWIVDAYHGRAHVALGYESWDAYCAAEFAGSRLQLPREDRTEVITSLRDAGMSVRAITSATGAGIGTVHRALSAVPNGTVDKELPIEVAPSASELAAADLARAERVFDGIAARVTSIDGRERPSSRPTTRAQWQRQVEAQALAVSGVRQVDIARHLGVAQSTVSDDLASLAQVATARGVVLDDVFSGGRVDPRALAEQLGVSTRPRLVLASTAKANVRDLQATLAVLMESVILADAWVEDDERAAAATELVPHLADVLLMVAKAVSVVGADLPESVSEEHRLRWSRTIAQAVDQIRAA